jgi:diguanylate cyclase (GGDEF)-like protein
MAQPPEVGCLPLRHVSAALLVFDDGGELGYLNSHAESLLGLEAQLVAGQRVGSLFRIEAPEGIPLTEDRLLDPHRRPILDETIEGCVLERPDGQRLQVTCEIAPGGCGSVLVLLHPTRVDSTPDSLAYRASHDYLTGLPNRSCLQERLEHLHRSTRARERRYSLLLLDLDHFKRVNDRFGHAAGDRVLVEVASRIAHKVRELDTVGRWGGEEFLCLLPDVGRAVAVEIAERIRTGVEAQPVACQAREIPVTSSVGIASFPDDGLHPDTLLAKADAALYEAKRSGRNRIRIFTDRAGNELALARIIEESGCEERLRVVYRPILSLASRQVCGEKAIAQIRLDDREVRDAANFFAVAEQLHLAHRIDQPVIRGAISRIVNLERRGEPVAAMFVTPSADFLRRPDLLDDLREILGRRVETDGNGIDGVNPLVIGVGERQLIGEIAEVKERLQPFLDMGVRVAINDFGTGCSSLAYLIELPVSFVKLEGSLVRRVCRERRICSLLRGIQELASGLGIITVAEGAENRQTLDVLRGIGVDWAQGRYISRSASRQ